MANSAIILKRPSDELEAIETKHSHEQKNCKVTGIKIEENTLKEVMLSTANLSFREYLHSWDFHQTKNLEYTKETKEWENYIHCNWPPISTCEPKLTEFLSRWSDEKENRLDGFLKKSFIVEQILEDLEKSWCKAVANGNISERIMSKEYCNHLFTILEEKHKKVIVSTVASIQKMKKSGKVEFQDSWSAGSNLMQWGIWGYLRSKGVGGKKIAFREMGVTVFLPKSARAQIYDGCPGILVTHFIFDRHSLFDRTFQLTVLGGVVKIDFILIPTQPTVSEHWEIHCVHDEDTLLGTVALQSEFYPGKNSAKEHYVIDYYISGDCIIDSSEIRIIDASTTRWLEYRDIVNYDLVERKITFIADKLGSFALTQRRNLQYPFIKWTCRPQKKSCVIFHLTTQRHELNFLIDHKGVKLLDVDHPQLQGLAEFYIETEEILLKLQRHGIDLLSSEIENVKNNMDFSLENENQMYNDLVDICFCCDIISISTKKLGTTDGILLKVRPNPFFEEPQFDGTVQPEFRLLFLTPENCRFLKYTYEDGTLTDASQPSKSIRECLWSEYLKKGMNSAFSACYSSSARENLRTLLTALRPFTYTSYSD